MITNIATTLSRIRVGGAKNSRGLGELDRGVITVALLVAALDGTVQNAEFLAVKDLAAKCRGITPKTLRALLDDALAPVGKLMAMAQISAYSEKDRLGFFLDAAKKAMPRGFAAGSLADLRRAFALWIGIGIADGEFSVFERVALAHLALQCAVIKKRPLIEAGFFAKAERIMTDLASPAKRKQAAADLEELVTKVEVKNAKGKVTRKSSASIAVKLALLGTLCFAGAGAAEAASSPHGGNYYSRMARDRIAEASNVQDGAIEAAFDQLVVNGRYPDFWDDLIRWFRGL